MTSKGGGGYGGGPYYQNASNNNNDNNLPIAEATPVAEAVPASAATSGGGYVPPTYDGTYARPPPISPYHSSISAEPAAYSPSSSSYQHGGQPGQLQSGQGGRAPQPLQPYPGLPTGGGQQQQQQQQGDGVVMGQAVPGQPQQQATGPVRLQPNGQPMTGEQVNPRLPFACQCPHCAANVTTQLSFVANGFTFLGCLGLALLGCYPCCIIPFCIPDCKTAVHVCPRCRNVIAVA